MKEDSTDLSEHGLALLALQLRAQDRADATETCADEQLAALYSGSLADAERARVLSAIAHDRDTYRRWLSLVEANHSVDAYYGASAGSAQEPHSTQPDKPAIESVPVPRKPAVWLTLREKWRRWYKPLSYATGALATAVFAFVMISPGAPDDQARLDQLYREYGQESMQLLQAHDTLPDRSAGLGGSVERDQTYSPVQTALAKGIVAGLQAFASNASIPDLAINKQKYNSHQNQLPQADQAALEALGRLVVLTYPRCQHTQQNDFYRQAGPLYLRLSQQLRPARYAALSIMEAMPAADGVLAQKEICMISVNLINQFKA